MEVVIRSVGFGRTGRSTEMSVNKPLFTACVAMLVAIAVSAQASPGTMFRLEVGLPVAAGTAKKIVKDGKKTVLAVRAVVCEDLANVRITGTAEGLVNGARQSIPLTLTAVDQSEAVYAVVQQWPDNGAWVLHLKGSCAKPKAAASTLVPMNKGPFIREKTEVLREPATDRQLEAALTALARSQS